MQNQQTANDGVAAAATTSSSSSSSSSTTSTDLLLEAARLSQAAYADTAAAPSSWTAVALAEIAEEGVQRVDVGAIAGLPAGAITSAAHVYGARRMARAPLPSPFAAPTKARTSSPSRPLRCRRTTRWERSTAGTSTTPPTPR